MILSNNNGTFTPVAGGNGTFIGTAAAFNAIKDTLPVNTVAYITDDGNGDLQPVDAVTNGDMHPVTSNAVYDTLKDGTFNINARTVVSNGLPDDLHEGGEFELARPDGSTYKSLGKLYIDSYEGYYIGWQLPMLCTILAALFILALLLHPKGIVAQIIGSKLLSYIGRISFVIYLVHMFFVPFLKFGSDIRSFLSVYLVSLCIAVVLHIMVEKPSIILAKNKKIREVMEYFQNLVASL